MRMLFATIVLSAAALSSPALAGTIGCKPGEPMNASAKATNCRDWPQAAMATPMYRPYHAAYAYVPEPRIRTGGRTNPPTGVSGGAAE